MSAVPKKGPFAIPTIKGRIAERLEGAEPRFEEGDSEMEFPDEPAEIVFDSPEERGAVALACLIVENLKELGGTRAPKRALQSAARKTLETFDRKEVMEIEIEAYEILLWLASAIDPEWSRQEPEEIEEISPESSKLELLRWSIGGHHDLMMEYYTHGRGELTERRVTPISLEAETYLHGYCHLRRDDRVFRISRIAELWPVEAYGSWEPDEFRTRREELAEEGGAESDSGKSEEGESEVAQLDLLS